MRTLVLSYSKLRYVPSFNRFFIWNKLKYGNSNNYHKKLFGQTWSVWIFLLKGFTHLRTLFGKSLISSFLLYFDFRYLFWSFFKNVIHVKFCSHKSANYNERSKKLFHRKFNITLKKSKELLRELCKRLFYHFSNEIKICWIEPIPEFSLIIYII